MRRTALAWLALLAVASCGSNASGDGDGGADGSTQATPDAAIIDTSPRLAGDIAIREVAVFQAVQVTVARDGAAVSQRNAPIVAGRAAVVRVLVDPGPSWSSKAVTGELIVTTPGTPSLLISEAETVAGPSTYADTSTSFEFLVPAERMTTDASFSARLIDPGAAPVSGNAGHDSRYPRDGSEASIGAQSDAGGIDIVLVPVQYDTDGSGRLPDTSAEQLAVIESLLTSLYPITQVNLTVHTPLPWTGGLTWSGSFDFGDLNQALIDLKEADGAPSATYYYGMVRPADTYSAYCGGSCVTGQAFVVKNPSSGRSRVGSGVGYSGEKYARTLAHEVGHMHGRSHAPCDTSSSDPDYPHAGGSIGVWGYDPRSEAYLSPDVATDLMGYCDDRWISDYNFAAFFDRIQALASTAAPAPSVRRVPHQFLRLAEGDAQWGRRVRVAPASPKTATRIQFLGRDGEVLSTSSAELLREAHGDAEWILLPAPPLGTTHVSLKRRGFAAATRIAL